MNPAPPVTSPFTARSLSKRRPALASERTLALLALDRELRSDEAAHAALGGLQASPATHVDGPHEDAIASRADRLDVMPT